MQAIFDSCHSGTALGTPFPPCTPQRPSNRAPDLDYIYHSNGRLWRSHQVSPKARKEKQTPADVISFCACKDSGTSADTQEGGEAVGAMSYVRVFSALFFAFFLLPSILPFPFRLRLPASFGYLMLG